tara:strand:+ start:3442 stop:4146 length:705 start_codon:yes stop_codon:yes gene_type:complete
MYTFFNKISKTIMEGYIQNNGLYLGLGTISLVTCLELTNLSSVVKLIRYNGIYSYVKAWAHTIVNSALFGPIVYHGVRQNLLDVKEHTIIVNIINIPTILLLHSYGYWVAHNMMHKKYLWCIHKYHHTYSCYVTPVVAMAVSPMEYSIAYMFPFIFASCIITPSNFELLTSATIISVCNLMIHCPSIEYFSKYYPDWWVSPGKHLKHHYSKSKCHIAAPTIDIDFLIVLFSGYW